MALSWNEIKSRAVEFSKEWENESSEDAEAKTFWDGFFNVFGLTRRRLASFEVPVVLKDRKYGYIDLFWKGKLMVEHKSKGKDLGSALAQAKGYFEGIPEKDLPRYIIVSDFGKFRFYDLDEGKDYEFALSEFPEKAKLFGFLAGYEKVELKEEDPVNQKAVKLMANLYNELSVSGYDRHDLSVFLVRTLFCLFADDTGIFNENPELLAISNKPFHTYLEIKTNIDGSDLGMHLAKLFEVLSAPKEERSKNLDEFLMAFPYVNGGLFDNKESNKIPDFSSKARERLLEACDFDWKQISPAIFGSMFQGVMDEAQRRALGAHYTSETNIFKLINALFLDDLRAELKSCGNSVMKLNEFLEKLGKLKFLDPACGCGNFLVIAYRELRMLELEALRKRFGNGGMLPISLSGFVKVKPDQFYGIELEEFPARIAQTAMWLVDHQMNELASKTFGRYVPTLPLKAGVKIIIDNALTTDWKDIIAPDELSYILGNPPFIGHHLQTLEQKQDLHHVLQGVDAAGVMDYVSAWYVKAGEYIQNSQIKAAFVSTNSISQGEQVGILWHYLFEKFNLKIHFAHRTFKWANEARGKAAVYCVIIGFAAFDSEDKRIYEYVDIKGEPHEIKAKNINPYLIDAPDILLENRSKPICNVPAMMYGSKPTDGGNFLLSDEEKEELLKKEPEAAKFIKQYVSAEDYLYSQSRWCLWLVEAKPEELRKLPLVMERVEKVKAFRQSSKALTTRNYPHHTLFRQVTQPDSDYILVPSTTSEIRKYIPMGFMSKDVILSNASFAVPNCSLYHFGVLESEMHMAWVRQVCGRLKSDFRYSKDIVYNNFPWTENPSEEKVKAIEQAAQMVLDARAAHPGASLADLYDPLTMPPDLVKAHQDLDRAVDSAYTRKTFKSDAERLEFLFELYKKYLDNLG